MGEIFRGAGATFLRVEFTLLLAGLWTIPVGVYIGLRPRLSAVAQPIAQIAASVPATALFPIVLLVLIRVGGGLGVGSIVLLLLGTQWYILFNVIAGASAIPTDLKGSLRRLPHAPPRALAQAASARRFSRTWSRDSSPRRAAPGTPASWRSIPRSRARHTRPSGWAR